MSELRYRDHVQQHTEGNCSCKFTGNHYDGQSEAVFLKADCRLMARETFGAIC